MDGGTYGVGISSGSLARIGFPGLGGVLEEVATQAIMILQFSSKHTFSQGGMDRKASCQQLM